MEPNRFSSTIGFIDLLFLTLLGFVFLFIMAFIMMNPPIEQNVKPKADIMVIMEWEDNSPHDIDLWCRLPNMNGAAVGYSDPKIGLVHLDRDDRGNANDLIETEDGVVVNPRNHEVMTWRGMPPGTYTINGMFYGRGVELDAGGLPAKDIPGAATVQIQLILLNPKYKLLKTVEFTLHDVGDEETAFSFTITNDGEITNINTEDLPFVNKRFEQRSMQPRILRGEPRIGPIPQ